MSLWKNRPKHIAEYFGLRLFAGLVRRLPYRAALSLGWFVALIAHFVVRWRTAEARRRIREVFGDTISESRVRNVAWISMRNLAFNAVDSVRLPALTRAWVERHTDYADVQKVLDVSARGGSILVVPHMGSWDLAGVAGNLFGLPMFIIVGTQKNPLTDEFVNRMRGITGVETIPRDSGALRGTIKRLKAGRLLTIMTDLRSKTPGVKARFLGKEANLVAGMGMFARMANVPIIPAVVTRRGWTRHIWRVSDPIYPDISADRDADIARMTQQVMDIFDRAIRAEPEQYFWYNKRWVLDPLEPADQMPAQAAAVKDDGTGTA